MMTREMIDFFAGLILIIIAMFHLELWLETRNAELDVARALPGRRNVHLVLCITLVAIGGYYCHLALTRM